MKQLLKDDRAKKNPMGNDTKYSRAIRVPQYEPKNTKPELPELCDMEKYGKLLNAIKKSKVSEEEKTFLTLAASRHLVFSYSKIADYYAHASKEMQRLMEQSALVIIDMDDAIANGYVALSEKMQQLIDEEKERDKRAREAARVLKAQRELAVKKAKEAKDKEKQKKAEKEMSKKETEDFVDFINKPEDKENE